MDSNLKRLNARIFWFQPSETNTEAVLRFRRQLFVDKLGWALSVDGQFEVDEFDVPRTCFVALWQQDKIVGAFRAIRTDLPYLAEKVFPGLAVTRSYPKTSQSYEVSRFGIEPCSNREMVASTLYALMFHFALIRRAKSLVAVTDLFHERYLSQRNIRTRRFGPPITYTQQDSRGFKLVAGEIPIASQNQESLHRILSSLNGVHIHDETLVFGRQGISA
jgi:N-acyl-L-homoserine lactone synthetase